MSKPILSTSFLNQEVTCSPTDRAEMSDKTREEEEEEDDGEVLLGETYERVRGG